MKRNTVTEHYNSLEDLRTAWGLKPVPFKKRQQIKKDSKNKQLVIRTDKISKCQWIKDSRLRCFNKEYSLRRFRGLC